MKHSTLIKAQRQILWNITIQILLWQDLGKKLSRQSKNVRYLGTERLHLFAMIVLRSLGRAIEGGL